MARHDHTLKEGIEQAAVLPVMDARFSEDGLRVTNPLPLKVALIDTRTLFGEVLLSGLRVEDPSTQIAFYKSISDWASVRLLTGESIVLLSVDSRELEMNGEALRAQLAELMDAGLSFQLVLMSSSEDPDVILPFINAGAMAYISTSMTLRTMVRIIHLAAAGGLFVPFSIMQSMRMRTRSEPELKQAIPSQALLSPRQVLVAKALRRGTPNKVIAYDLNMCESTVKVHVRQIMKKLKARNRTQIAYLTNAMFEGEE